MLNISLQDCCSHLTFVTYSNSEHLLSVIGDILEINNFDMNSIEIHNTPFDFYQKMESIINSIYPGMRRESVTTVCI